MIKAVFFDIDGTLINYKMEMPESTKKALKTLRKKGLKVFIATGRNMMQMESLPVSNMHFDGYVTLNGQICLDGDKKMFYETPIEACDVKKILSLFEQKKIPILIVEENRMYINMIDDLVRQTQKEIHMDLPKLGEYRGATIYQFIVHAKEDTAQALLRQLPNCKMTRWHRNGMDIISKKSGKVAGIEQVLKRYGIQKEEIMAFGDGENDVDMLAYAGIGVAMGNAQNAAKEQADYITDSVDENGVQNALQYFGIL